jgi:hypothetical protein
VSSHPKDAIAQRQLVYRLALAIDLFGITKGAKRDLDALLDANPRSAFSTHVIHNLGARRARWLRDYAAARAGARLPVRSDTRSSP